MNQANVRQEVFSERWLIFTGLESLARYLACAIEIHSSPRGLQRRVDSDSTDPGQLLNSAKKLSVILDFGRRRRKESNRHALSKIKRARNSD
jgi:hypothetical protein